MQLTSMNFGCCGCVYGSVSVDVAVCFVDNKLYCSGIVPVVHLSTHDTMTDTFMFSPRITLSGIVGVHFRT